MRSLPHIPAVWVPLPQPPYRCRGLIISLDPTTEFISHFAAASRESYQEWRKQLFESNAIPKWIVERIEAFNRKFMSPPIPDTDLERFRRVLFEETYWTHLHKCCTDKRGEASLKFKNRNARRCADIWLRAELEAAVQDDAAYVISLGKDVERWVRTWHAGSSAGEKLQIFYLPHPSRANMASWHPKNEKTREGLEMTIRRFIELC